jgi:hypothetical protein
MSVDAKGMEDRSRENSQQALRQLPRPALLGKAILFRFIIQHHDIVPSNPVALYVRVDAPS